MLSKVIVNFENSVNRIENEDNISCLVFSESMVALASSPTGRISGQYTNVSDIASAWGASDRKSLVIYHASEFFRLNPNGILYVGCIGAEVQRFVDEMMAASQGMIRQFGFVVRKDVDVVTIGAIDTALVAQDAPAVSVVGIYEHNYAILAQDVLLSDNISILAHAEVGIDHPCIGTLLGAISRAKVSESVAWVDKFNLTGNGRMVKIRDNPTRSQVETLAASRYIVLRKYVGIDGVRVGNTDTTSGSTIEERRVVQKVTRIVRKLFTGSLNMPVLVNPETGVIAPSAAKNLEIKVESALNIMMSDAELSAYDVQIDMTQKVLVTKEVRIMLKVVPYGTAKNITINISLNAQL
jgi:hypothetical protein